MKALLTAGYGAGFSEWNNPHLAVDQRVVEAFEKNPEMSVDEFKSMCESFGYHDVMVLPGDLEVMQVVEAPEGKYFKIAAYDGWEYIEVFDPDSGEWFHS